MAPECLREPKPQLFLSTEWCSMAAGLCSLSRTSRQPLRLQAAACPWGRALGEMGQADTHLVCGWVHTHRLHPPRLHILGVTSLKTTESFLHTLISHLNSGDSLQ